MLRVKYYVCVMLLLVIGVSFAGVINIPGDYPTIQTGIDSANIGDTVVVDAGTYYGVGNKNLIFGGKAITVRSENGPENCIIDCQNSGRGFKFLNQEDSTSILEGFTIQNGYEFDCGGGIFCINSSSPTIRNMIIRDCHALHPSSGGGIYCNYSNPIISNCRITNNSARLGGGISCWNHSSPTIINCIVSDDSVSNHGGGIHCRNSSPTIINCAITDNFAYYVGGAMYCENSSPPIINCTIAGNLAGSGGGIWCHGCNTTLTNTILWGNIANGAESGNQIFTNVSSDCFILNYCDYADNTLNSNNILGRGTVTADPYTIILPPLFVDTTAHNYRLLETSPCIDAGITAALELPAQDLDGNNRVIDGNGDGVASVDMGAFEFVETETPQEMAEGINQEIQSLPADVFDRNPAQRKNAMSNKIEALIAMISDAEALIDAGLYEEAIDKLRDDIRPKMDGSLGGNPRNDWITDPDAQAELCAMVDGLSAYLEDVIAGIARRLADANILKPTGLFLNVYPNPFNAAIRIETPADAVISVYNIKGEEVDKFTGGSKLWTPDDNLAVGIYMVRASLNDETMMRRIIYLK